MVNLLFKRLVFALAFSAFLLIAQPAFATTYSLPLTVHTFENCLDGTSGWLADGSAHSELVGGVYACYMAAVIKIPWDQITPGTDPNSGVLHWQYINASNNFLTRLYHTNAPIDFIATPYSELSTPDYSPMLFDQSVALGDISVYRDNDYGFIMPGVFPDGGWARVPLGTFTITFDNPTVTPTPSPPTVEYSIPLTAKTYETCLDGTSGWVGDGSPHNALIGGAYACYMASVMEVPWDQVEPGTDLTSGVLHWQYTSATNDFYPFLYRTNEVVDFTSQPHGTAAYLDYPPKLSDNAAALGDLTYLWTNNLGLVMSGVFPNGGSAAIPLNSYTLTFQKLAQIFNTPAGSQVTVEPPDQTGATPITVLFNAVTQAGDTTLATSSTGQPPPSGFRLGSPPTYYDLSTTAVFDSAEVCIDYSNTNLDTNNQKENNLKLSHFVDGAWVDETTLLDPANNKICGTVTSFSPFAIFDPNVAPEVSIVNAPTDPLPVMTQVDASATFTDLDTVDQHQAVWDWGDQTTSTGDVQETGGSGVVTGSHIYSAPGVYTIKLVVTDEFGVSDESLFQFIVIYNPEGGFVTGGGTMQSPLGAYMVDPALTGKANFGFVSKYQPGTSIPTGSTEFVFQMGNLKFKSTAYEWLVVAGAKAQYKGSGRINGEGDYGFILTSIDGQRPGGGGQDKLRLKIYDKATGAIVYDNLQNADNTSDPITVITSGSIVIH